MKKKIWICLIAFVFLAVCSICLLHIPYERQSGIATSTSFFENEKVLFLVPHQDDEIYIGASTILNYLRAESEIYVAYTTNGDYYREEDTEIRRREAKQVLTDMGVAEENIFFLGYCNQYVDGKSEYLYTAKGVVTSDIGKTHTYGTEEYPDYHTMVYKEPAAYTRENLKSDIKDLILNLRPTVIYCIDFDVHVDHRTLSLLFEEAMPEILTEDASYQPRVYKGFAYVKDDYLDFYVGLNERSVQKPVTHLILDDTYDTDVPSYTWENRVRLPSADGLYGWTRRSSFLNKLLAMYESQNDKSFPRNTNSDDIFWERRTDSLTYDAELSVSSGMHKERLADFKLTDVSDIASKKTAYTNFLWSPELSDEQKSLTFTFATPQEISAIALYDDPDISNNILCARIEDADGNILAECKPSPKGEYSVFGFPMVITDKINVSIVAYEGVPGLAEVEIFKQDKRETEWIKLYLDNENETFVYHAYPEEDTVALRLYAYPNPDKSIGDYDISVEGEAEWKTENDRLIINGNFLQEVCITITDSKNSALSDTITIQKMSGIKRTYITALQWYEQRIDDVKEVFSLIFGRYVPYYWNLLLDKIQALFS